MKDPRPKQHVLMIAFHYPPAAGSSGLQRTLSFSRYLPAHGWQPLILTANARAYDRVRNDQLVDIPESVDVNRAFAIDVKQHLSICGRYPAWLARPDRWGSWCLGAVPIGLRMIRRHSPKLIWSTYPIATAHLIGSMLHRLTGIPWVADFRDPMVEEDMRTGDLFPSDPGIRRSRLVIEQRCVKQAKRIVFCTQGARAICTERYPGMPANRSGVIPNGFDEMIFGQAEKSVAAAQLEEGNMLRLVHSGVLYPGTDRDPGALLDALAALIASGRINENDLRIILRASGHEAAHRRAIEQRKLDKVVLLAPAVPYRDAIGEMLAADGLVLLQGYTSNPAIPAKLYEYLRARKPILALVDDAGDTAALLRKLGFGTLVPLDDVDRIAAGLLEFIDAIKCSNVEPLDADTVAQFSREAGAATLARLFDDCAAPVGADG